MKYFTAVMCILISSALYAQEQPKIPNVLEDAVVGEWAHYKQPGSTEIVYRVIDRTDTDIIILTQIYSRGKLVKQERASVNISKPIIPNENNKYIITQEDMTVNDTLIPCYVFENDKLKIWTSEKIPVYGQVMVTFNGQPTMELVSWGVDKIDKEEPSNDTAK